MSIDNDISYMIYSNTEYKISFYRDSRSRRKPVLEYIDKLDVNERAKVSKYIELLRASKGILDEPYSRHIKGKIRELRVDFAKNRHRIFYFTFVNKNIVLLHAFLKRAAKTPENEIKKAEQNYYNVLNNLKIYDQ